MSASAAKMDLVDAFEVLGIPPGRYDTDELARAYRARAKTVHPDRGGRREDWDALEVAYVALLREAPDWDGGTVSARRVDRVRLAWAGTRASTRITVVIAGAVLVVGAGCWPAAAEAIGDGVPWYVPAAVAAYLAGWVVWYVVRTLTWHR